VANLSAGERRRILLAGALASPADALLLDAPFAGPELAALRGRATLFVAHEWWFADRAVVLRDGRLTAARGPSSGRGRAAARRRS
jgi:ABC-type sulfate/molybdate transport systems ATPase subunit